MANDKDVTRIEGDDSIWATRGKSAAESSRAERVNFEIWVAAESDDARDGKRRAAKGRESYSCRRFELIARSNRCSASSAHTPRCLVRSRRGLDPLLAAARPGLRRVRCAELCERCAWVGSFVVC